ncbi:MAG TPA: hypothetical protein VMT74_06075 [Gaiellaceae bacterium]|nr:hypothetical protein [Gaiellaceae bacterium]
MGAPRVRAQMEGMAHVSRHRLAGRGRVGDARATLARQLHTGAGILLAAYGIVCLVLAFSDTVPGTFIDLGLVAFAAAWAGTRAPAMTGVLLVLSGALIGPATALLARAAGGTYAAAAPDRLLVLVFAVPVAAGILLLVAARLRHPGGGVSER